MAIAYATIGNGGTVVTPHVGLADRRRRRPGGQGIRPRARGATSRWTPTTATAILEGLHDAAQNGGGTSCTVFGGFPIPVAGKTGTAQRPPLRRPVLVRGAGALPEPAYRHRRDDGGRRLRRRIGGARRAADPGSVSSPSSSREGSGTGEGGEAGMMYATRARRARPEPFAVRPGIAERLGLPYMDWPLGFAAVGAGRLQRLHPRPGDRATTCPAAPATTSTARRSTPSSASSGCTCSPASTTRASASCGSASTPSSARASRSSSSSASPPAARGAPSNFPSSASSHRSSASSCSCWRLPGS